MIRPAFFVAIVFASMIAANAQTVHPKMVIPPPAKSDDAQKQTATSKENNSTETDMMPMSLVAPLVIEDAVTASILTVVHDAPTAATLNISVVGLAGQTLASFKRPLVPYGQTVVVLADELRKFGLLRRSPDR